MKRALTACLGALLLTVPSVAHAQDSGTGELTSGDEPRQPAPPARDDDASPSTTTLSLALVGSYRNVYDLSLVGGGGALRIEGTGPFAAGFDAQFFAGRSLGGLSFTDSRAMATIGGLIAPGLRLGGGLGVDVVTITRATDGTLLTSLGAAVMARIQYDFERGGGPFLNADFDVFLGSAIFWGPTVGVGYRF